jgi:hypothetical protein
VLVWDRTGYLMLYKRLERGTFNIPTEPAPGARHVEVDPGELTLMLEGLDLRGARRQPRWYRTASANGERPSVPAIPLQPRARRRAGRSVLA